MAIRHYTVPKIGSGKTPQDAFRPAHTDGLPGWSAVDTATGFILSLDATLAAHTTFASRLGVTAVLDRDIAALKTAALLRQRSRLP